MNNLKIFSVILFVTVSSGLSAQSDSFMTLKNHFEGEEDVYSFKVSGFLCRTVLWMAGEWEFRDAISEVTSIRLITIPGKNFTQQELSVSGFRMYLGEDHFESLASIKDHGDNVEIYLQQTRNRKDRYLVLVEEASEVTVIEIKGHIDIQKLKGKDTKLTMRSEK